MDYSKRTLGEMLSDANETIKRHAIGILKIYQKTNKYCLAQVGSNLCPNKAFKEGYCRKHFIMFREKD